MIRRFMFLILVGFCIMGSSHAKLGQIQLEVGMPRASVEKLVAEALATPYDYSPYGNNLDGGVVQYIEGETVLEVTYQAGTPAPWVVNAEGVSEHLPPVDETVRAFRFYEKH